MYDSLSCGISECRALISHDSLSESARYLRSSGDLVEIMMKNASNALVRQYILSSDDEHQRAVETRDHDEVDWDGYDATTGH